MVSGRKFSKPVCTLFGAYVLAEIPDSIRQHSPLSTRNVECTFIHMGLERGPVVQGFIRVDGKAELMRFVARNVRAISPLRWDLNSGQGVLTQFDNGTIGSRPQIVNDSGTAPADLSQLPPEELAFLSSSLLALLSEPCPPSSHFYHCFPPPSLLSCRMLGLLSHALSAVAPLRVALF